VGDSKLAPSIASDGHFEVAYMKFVVGQFHANSVILLETEPYAAEDGWRHCMVEA
jgi:hypothetical protein